MAYISQRELNIITKLGANINFDMCLTYEAAIYRGGAMAEILDKGTTQANMKYMQIFKARMSLVK